MALYCLLIHPWHSHSCTNSMPSWTLRDTCGTVGRVMRVARVLRKNQKLSGALLAAAFLVQPAILLRHLARLGMSLSLFKWGFSADMVVSQVCFIEALKSWGNICASWSNPSTLTIILATPIMLHLTLNTCSSGVQ